MHHGSGPDGDVGAVIGGLPRHIAPPPATQPAPHIGPETVVAAQLAALKRRDATGVWAWASPENRAVTGPLQRFEHILQVTTVGDAVAAFLNQLQWACYNLWVSLSRCCTLMFAAGHVKAKHQGRYLNDRVTVT
jgi:hypothetical protein